MVRNTLVDLTTNKANFFEISPSIKWRGKLYTAVVAYVQIILSS